MSRPLWKGAIAFGMVSIPVKLYAATESKDVSFHLLHKSCHTRIKQQRSCEHHQEVVPWNDVVRGYEYAPDQYVVLTEEDFGQVQVNTVHTIEISQFVQLDEIDPIFYEKAYYLEPDEVAVKPFALLRRTLAETERVAIAKITIRQKELLCTLRVDGSAGGGPAGIVLETMLYPDEIRSTAELALPAEDVEINPRELQMAKTLVDMLTEKFEPSQHRDNYREALLELIEAKVQGQEISRPKAAAGKVIDLMSALRASIQEAKKERAAAGAPTRGREPAPAEAAEMAAPRRRARRAGG